MAIRQSVLLSKSTSYREPIYESMRKSASIGKTKSAFLCHSHKDEEIVMGLIVLFQETGVDLYIDWKDHAMPETPNAETARRIQQKIKSCDLFFFLATYNSKISRWCPWEIGYADSGSKRIIIIPTSDSDSSYGNEYLQLYPRIDMGFLDTKRALAIFEANAKEGRWLSTEALN